MWSEIKNVKQTHAGAMGYEQILAKTDETLQTKLETEQSNKPPTRTKHFPNS